MIMAAVWGVKGLGNRTPRPALPMREGSLESGSGARETRRRYGLLDGRNAGPGIVILHFQSAILE